MKINRNYLNWWKKIFNEKYLKTYIDIIPPERTLKETRWLLKFIKKNFKKKKIKILDLACGYGRHSIPLAKAGHLVVGVDYSRYFLNLAKTQIKNLNIKNLKLIRQDIRKLQFKNYFDLVINIFTSFGYFTNENDNILVLKNVFKALKRGGYFILDLENPGRWMEMFLKNRKYENNFLTIEDIRKQSNELLVKTQITFDHYSLKIFIRRSWVENKKKNGYISFFKLYYPEDISSILKLIGFKIKKIIGSFDNSKFTNQSPRMIIISSKA